MIKFTSTRNWVGGLFCAALATVSLLIMVGCADDLYAPCQLDPNSNDDAVSNCGADTGSEDKSCVVENQVQCDTRVCGRFSGSDPFCTKRCTEDGDCPGGLCVEFVFQTGDKYCVENALVE